MWDAVSGIGIMEINKTACTPDKSILWRQQVWGQKCSITGDELEPGSQKSGGLEEGAVNSLYWVGTRLGRLCRRKAQDGIWWMMGWVDVDLTGRGNDWAKVWEGEMAWNIQRTLSYADRLELTVQEDEVGNTGKG